MTLHRPTPLSIEVGLRTAALHALLDVEGDPARQLAAFRQARRELDALIRQISNETQKAQPKRKRK